MKATIPLVILMDVDGVVADFANHLIKQVGADFTLEDVKEWDFFTKFTEAEKRYAHEILQGPEFWLTQPVIKGAVKGIEKLRNDGHEIIWVTSPWDGCRQWEACRKDWLAEHFSATSREIVTTPRKELVYGDVLVDDKPANIIAWQAQWSLSKAFVFTQPYNRNTEELDYYSRWTWSKIPDLSTLELY